MVRDVTHGLIWSGYSSDELEFELDKAKRPDGAVWGEPSLIG